jgi:hypothetical protein
MKEYLTKMTPDQNLLTLFDTDVLVAVVNGKIDLNKEAFKVLRNRGLNKDGEWIGFDKK